MSSMHRSAVRSPAAIVAAEDALVGEAGGAIQVARWLIWVYVFLLLFEGALRKWIVPSLSGPLLIVRDPVVLLIYFVALAGGIFPRSRLLIAFWIVALGGTLFGVVAEHLDWSVYLYGWHADFLHLPLIFVIGRVLNYRDVVRLGRWFLFAAIPMTVLVVMQFMVAPTHLLNTTAGGRGLQLGTSGGKVRASGTFTFIVGIVSFYAMICGFLLNGLMKKGTYPRWVLATGAVCITFAMAASGSRSAIAGVLMVVAGVGIILVANPALLGRAVVALAALLLVAGLVMQVAVVDQGVEVMSMRFEEAGGSAGIWSRIFEPYLIPFAASSRASLFGYGLGFGTNAGAALSSGGVSPFLLGENEWQRVIMESGPIVGNMYLLWRICLIVMLFTVSITAAKKGNVLPLMLFSASASSLLSGQFGQPTILGFSVLGAGLCLAAAHETVEAPVANTPALERHRVRSRSRYAQILHGRT